MERNGGGGGGASWDLRINWPAPGTSACQPFPPHDQVQQQQLGKRPCFWGGEGHDLVACDQAAETSGGGGAEGRRKERALGAGAAAAAAAAAAVPRCQVEGCHIALAGAKEYHRRHKVCELHSKAPRVVVLGVEQRFCQQCSRFHAIAEFDGAKRSCRRRLSGHNERRRKSNASEAMARSSAAHTFGTSIDTSTPSRTAS